MKLSIIILTCDKDVHYIPTLLQNIKDKVTIEHEVIIVDNTIDETLDDIDGVNIIRHYIEDKLVKMNTRQLDSRKISALQAKGDYVWYVDADDEVLDVNNSVLNISELTEDIIVFSKNHQNEVIQSSVEKLFDVGVSNWNKWYKKNVLNEALSKVYDGSQVSIYEDNLIVGLALKYSSTIRFLDRDIYIFREDRSFSQNHIFSNIDDFEFYFTGYMEFNGILLSCFAYNEIFSMYQGYLGNGSSSRGGTLISFTLGNVLNKVLATITYYPNLLEPMLLRISKDVSPHYIFETLFFYDICGIPNAKEAIKKAQSLFGTEKIKHRLIVSFTLDTSCNKQCIYCLSKKSSTLTDDEMFNNFDKALSFFETQDICVSPQLLGGEPNIWSEYLCNKLVDRLSKYEMYLVFTNGTDRNGFWYKQENCNTLTHVIDWETNMVNYEPVTERDTPTIIVTHKTLPILEDYLKINKNKNILVSPCTGSSDELDITIEDAKIIRDILAKFSLPFHLSIGKFQDECSLPMCTGDNVPLAVNCNNLTVSPCCKASNFISLDKFNFSKKPDCSNCKISMF